ncbi:Gluconolaconase [Novosphingobium lubricantis]
MADRLGLPASSPETAAGWSVRTLVPPAALVGANGMRIGPDGDLYVAQAFGSQLSAVDIATGATRVVSAADGLIVAPDDVAFDSHGNLFVTEVMSARVSALRPNGAVDVIAADVPVANGITVHADRIFMSEFNPEGRILELDPQGGQPRQIASGLMMPNALCMGPDGMLYFPLVPLGEVWRVSPDGGQPERVIGGLDIPTAVKFDPAGRLFVVESGSGRITRIDIAAQTCILHATVAYGIDNFAFADSGAMYVSHFTDGEIVEVAPSGAQRVVVAGGMAGPYGMCAGNDGTIVVADGMSFARVDPYGRVDRPAMLLQHGFPGFIRGVAVTASGETVFTNSAGQCARYHPGGEAQILAEGLDRAMAVAVAADGATYVCDSGAGRIVAIASDGTTRTAFAGLDRPVGLAVADDGGLFVSEAGAGALVHLSHLGRSVVLSGLDDPHGVGVLDGQPVVLDRGSGTLHLRRADGMVEMLASGLPAGTDGGMAPHVLPGIAGLMPGPLLPFADIAVLSDGTIAVGGDRSGAIIAVSRRAA